MVEAQDLFNLRPARGSGFEVQGLVPLLGTPHDSLSYDGVGFEGWRLVFDRISSTCGQPVVQDLRVRA